MTDFWTWFTVLVGGGSLLAVAAAGLVTILCTLVPLGVIGYWIFTRAKQRDAMVQIARAAWQTTTGRVLIAEVQRHGSTRHRSIRPVIVYAYDVNGQSYRSDQIRAGDKFLRVAGMQEAHAKVTRYPVGAIVTVHYNPANPQEAALGL